MPIVSVTRLHLRSPRFILPFFLYTYRSRRQAVNAAGNLGARIRKTKGLAFWTLSLWRDVAAMRSFVMATPHSEAMQRLSNWCNEAAFADWEANANGFPPWKVAADKLRANGRLAHVLHPSGKHEAGEIVIS